VFLAYGFVNDFHGVAVQLQEENVMLECCEQFLWCCYAVAKIKCGCTVGCCGWLPGCCYAVAKEECNCAVVRV